MLAPLGVLFCRLSPGLAVPFSAVEADMSAGRFIDFVRQSGTRKIVKLDLKCDDVIAEVVDLVLSSRLAVGAVGRPGAMFAPHMLVLWGEAGRSAGVRR